LGAALGIVGIAGYIGAGVQDILSGNLIGGSKTMVEGVKQPMSFTRIANIASSADAKIGTHTIINYIEVDFYIPDAYTANMEMALLIHLTLTMRIKSAAFLVFNF
jgi:hypothetical protein